MSVIYLDSSATGAGDGSTWTDAFTTIAAALAAVTPGSDQIWMNKFHYEVITPTWTPDPGGDAYNITPILSVDKATNTYSPATSANVNFNASGGQSNLNTSIAWRGISMTVANAFLGGTTDYTNFDDMYFGVFGTNSRLYLNGGAYQGFPVVRNTSAYFEAGSLWGAGVCRWNGGVIYGTKYASDNFLRYQSTSYDGVFDFVAVDFSGLASAGTQTFYDYNLSPVMKSFLRYCALPEWAKIYPFRTSNPEIATPGDEVHEDATDSVGDNISSRMVIRDIFGNSSASQVTYRDGGFYDPDTSAGASIQMQCATGIAPKQYMPHAGPRLYGTLDAAGETTITVECFEDNWADPPADGEFWVEIRYPGPNGTCLALVSTRGSKTTTGAAYPASSETWSGATGNAFSVSAAITAASAGAFEVRPFLGKYESGKYIFICPKLTIV
jgi:hypothetical protein